MIEPGGTRMGFESGLQKFYCTSDGRPFREGDRGGIPVLKFSGGSRRISSGDEEASVAAIFSSQEIAHPIDTT